MPEYRAPTGTVVTCSPELARILGWDKPTPPPPPVKRGPGRPRKVKPDANSDNR